MEVTWIFILTGEMSFVLSQFALNSIMDPAMPQRRGPRGKPSSDCWPVWGGPVRALVSQQQ